MAASSIAAYAGCRLCRCIAQENVRQSQSTSRHHGEVIVIEDLEEDDAPHEDEPVGVEVHRHHSVETAHDDRRPDDREHSTSQKAALKVAASVWCLPFHFWFYKMSLVTNLTLVYLYATVEMGKKNST